jgi:hypothetical protein
MQNYEPIFLDGQHKRSPNPNPEIECVPELAYMTAADQDEMIADLDRNKRPSQNPAGADHPRYRVPRSKSIWPGQQVTCRCGGRLYLYGKYLKCKNAVARGPRTCWCHVQVYCDVVRAKVLPWVMSVLDGHPEFRDRLIDAAWQEMENQRLSRQRSDGDLDRRIARLRKEAAQLVKAIREGGELKCLVEELAVVEADIAEAIEKKKRWDEEAEAAGVICSRDEVAERIDEVVELLARTSYDFADLLRRLIPEFVIQPVQALDCPFIRPRARITLRLDAWAEPGEAPVEESTTIDLFEPPVHIKHVEACVAARATSPRAGLRAIAKTLGIGYMTVKRSLAYHRRMQDVGLDEPYREIHERPERASRWKKRKKMRRRSPADAPPHGAPKDGSGAGNKEVGRAGAIMQRRLAVPKLRRRAG